MDDFINPSIARIVAREEFVRDLRGTILEPPPQPCPFWCLSEEKAEKLPDGPEKRKYLHYKNNVGMDWTRFN